MERFKNKLLYWMNEEEEKENEPVKAGKMHAVKDMKVKIAGSAVGL